MNEDDDDYLSGLIDGWIIFGNMPRGWFGVIVIIIILVLVIYYYS